MRKYKREGGVNEQEARLPHAKYYCNLIAVAEELYVKDGENIQAGLRLFDVDRGQIQIGQIWAAQKYKELCSYYANVGVYVLLLHLTPKESITWLEPALSAARQMNDKAREGAHLGSIGAAYAALVNMLGANLQHTVHLVPVRNLFWAPIQAQFCFDGTPIIPRDASLGFIFLPLISFLLSLFGAIPSFSAIPKKFAADGRFAHF
jgi:hypothetical protein